MLEFCGNWSHALSIACALLCPVNLTESIRKNAPGKEKGGGKRTSGRTKIGCVVCRSERKDTSIWGKDCQNLRELVLAIRILLKYKAIFTSQLSKWTSARRLTSQITILLLSFIFMQITLKTLSTFEFSSNSLRARHHNFYFLIMYREEKTPSCILLPHSGR